MLDIGVQEILVIMVLALIVFGPDKLPDLGRRLGRAMREFRRASDEFRSTVEQNLQLNLDADITSPPPASSGPTAATATTAAVGAADGHGAATDGHGAAETSPVAHGEHHGSGTVDAQASDEPLEPYWTSRGGRLFHRRECAWRARVPVSERIPLTAPSEGLDQGLKPCPVCDPKEVAVAS
jgi:sec-independent protein translocase protein TatA